MTTVTVRRYIYTDRHPDAEDSDVYLCDECVEAHRYAADRTPLDGKHDGEDIQWLTDLEYIDDTSCADCDRVHLEDLFEDYNWVGSRWHY